MHSFNEVQAGVPAFLAKLWRLVEDPETNDLICWREDGKSFIIQNQAQFAKELLPLNYKHNNMASFIRQLNMYGFHKITSIDNGGLKFDRDEMEFSHPYFQKDQPFLLEHIKRKIANQKPTGEDKGTLKPETFTKVINEVKTVRGRQDTLDSRFSAMKQENEALWREIAVLRQKHIKQQQIVNKLIQFLVTIVQPTRSGSSINNMSGVKRRFQLMINNVPDEDCPAKMRTLNNQESGPIIHELTEDLFDNVNYDDELQHSPNVLSPGQDNDSGADDVSTPITFKIEKPDPHYDQYEHGGEPIIEDVDENNFDFIVNDDMEPENVNFTSKNTVVKRKSSSADAKGFGHLKMQNNSPSNDGKKLTNTKSPPKATGKANYDSILNVNQNRKINQKRDPNLRLKVNNIEKNKSNTISIPSTSSLSSSTSSSSSAAAASTLPSSKTTGKGKIMPTESTSAKATNDYTRTDFLTNEMPSEIFNSTDDSALNNFNTISESFNSTQSEDYAKKFKQTSSSSSSPLSSSLPTSAATGTSAAPIPTKNMALTKYNNAPLRLNSREDVHSHIDTIQSDIDSLKDFFQNDDYTLDPNTLLGIFGDLEAPYEMSLNPDFGMDKRNDVPSTSGSELISYQPINLDLSEFLNPSSPTAAPIETNEEDLTDKDLNTPSIDKKKLSFKRT